MTRRSSWPLGYIHMCLTVSMSHFLLPSNTGLTLLSTGGRLCLWPGLFSYYLPPPPLPPYVTRCVCLWTWGCLCLPRVLRGGTQWGAIVPQWNLAHLVVVGYGRFTHLPLEVQLQGEVQVALQVEEREKRKMSVGFERLFLLVSTVTVIQHMFHLFFPAYLFFNFILFIHK